ncbi:MAG: phospholipid carrier-dependent glycosyltransferase [Candidatus Eremiobacteraeota bacterium]|nr:phospholipid carrier-dependent glycosyltransferase [Candidatus Eremiobacteraeota bacterium]MBC5826476.1 phospholipid carrier-dependent glycosyltransferase [Candidatus Eremiobacteraeota bacterium]
MARPNAGTLASLQKKKSDEGAARLRDAPAATGSTFALNRGETGALAALGLVAILIRLILVPLAGHVTDVGTFEAWTQSLIKYGAGQFYAHAGFVDYPPGYMLVLWLTGLVYKATFMAGDSSLTALRIFVKLPAVLADVGLTYLVYLIARRSYSASKSLFAAAVIALNPAVWLVSAYWGQADSVAAVFLLWAIYLAVTRRYEWAWAALALAVLIKPQPLVFAPMLAAWQVRSAVSPRGALRVLVAPLIGLIVAYLGSVAFAPHGQPGQVLAWLYDRYHAGMSVYPFNSVNAFNLYSVSRDFWQPDNLRILGIPQYVWGTVIFVFLLAALVLRQWRTTGTDRPDADRERSFYTAAFVALLGLFMLTTRMHERYMFSALAVAPLIWNIGSLQRLVVSLLSLTFVANLFYALQYLFHQSTDLHPLEVHGLSLLNVACLFFVAGVYLIDEMGTAVDGFFRAAGSRKAMTESWTGRRVPLIFEGLVGLSKADYLIAGGLTAATGILLLHNIGAPHERIFDEIYYARAAQEYLAHKDIYEYTHPPLPKLIMAVAVWLFRGMPDPQAARVASALFGTLTVPLLYAFAKRLFSSTAFAAVAVFLLLTSGYHYVQSRIATPEIFLAFFALLTLYCTYRLWTASQIVARPARSADVDLRPFTATGGVVLLTVLYAYVEAAHQSAAPYVVFIAILAAVCTAAYLQERRRTGAMIVYPDGTRKEGDAIRFPWGERRSLKSAASAQDGQSLRFTAEAAVLEEHGGVLQWQNDGAMAGTHGRAVIRDAQRWPVWLLLSSLAVACVISSKWVGSFDLTVIWCIAALVSAQQFLPLASKPKESDGGSVPWRLLWGNPFGFRLPLFVAATLLATAVVYFLCYIPYFSQGAGHSFRDLVNLQLAMFRYHYSLVATHPYSSKWWTWPLELRPVSYYYKPFGGSGPTQIVAEILAVPNPAVWWAGVITVPLAGWLAWRERHKGMMLCVFAYLVQWLPWAASPRIDFQYNFYPNLAIICLCSAYALARLWSNAGATEDGRRRAQIFVGCYLAVCLALFLFFFPVLSGDHISWRHWHERMWLPYGWPYGWI